MNTVPLAIQADINKLYKNPLTSLTTEKDLGILRRPRWLWRATEAHGRAPGLFDVSQTELLWRLSLPLLEAWVFTRWMEGTVWKNRRPSPLRKELHSQNLRWCQCLQSLTSGVLAGNKKPLHHSAPRIHSLVCLGVGGDAVV